MSDETVDGVVHPASRRVARALREAIERGTYQPGDRLPSYRDLVSTEGIALGTAREAVRLLEQDGWVVVRHGSGAYVREVDPESTEFQLRTARAALVDMRGKLGELAAAVAEMERQADQAIGHIPPAGA